MEREQILKVMVPVGALGLLLVIVGVVIALNSGGTGSTDAKGSHDGGTPAGQSSDRGGEGKSPVSAVPKFDFPLDGPEWKEVDGQPGLKYWDVKEGSGDVCPTLAEKPSIVPIMHYSGWLTNGTLFDTSKTKGRPLDMPLRKLISGWQQGVPGMKVGGVRRLLIPSDLGYGPQGSPPTIPGGATLVFEMELLKVS